jgi:hypothetical protein
MARALSGRRCRAAGLLFVGDRYDGTDHQAFDPNRDNRHFKRGSICGLLGRVGASRVLGRLPGPVQRVALPIVDPRRQAIAANHQLFLELRLLAGLQPLAAPTLLWRQTY